MDVRLAECLGVWVHVYKSPIGLPLTLSGRVNWRGNMQPAFSF